MLHLVYGQDARLVPWVKGQLGINDFGPCAAIGIARDRTIIGAAVYHNQHIASDGKPFMIEITFCTLDKRWATRAIIYGILAHPFYQYRVKRLQATVSKRNRAARSFLKHLGFMEEGVGRQAWRHGGDAVMYSLLSGEFFSSKWNLREQRCAVTTSSPRSQYNGGSSDGFQSTDCAL